jgi:hypothetical protein
MRAPRTDGSGQFVVGKLPLEIQTQIQRVEPSRCGPLSYFPCWVLLKSGATFARVYVVEQSSYLQVWGVYPWDDPSKEWLDIEDLESLGESPARLPAPFANELYATGESGMGYSVFTAVFRDGSTQAYLTGNAVDFIEYPLGKNQTDVVAVIPNVGREASPIQAPRYSWCLYADDRTETAANVGLTTPMRIQRRPALAQLTTQLRRLLKGE